MLVVLLACFLGAVIAGNSFEMLMSTHHTDYRIIIVENSCIAVYSVKAVKFVTLQSFNIPAPSLEQCPRVMSEAGLSANFAPMVTHSIHSLTVEDIRYYFKPDATEENCIPTGNVL